MTKGNGPDLLRRTYGEGQDESLVAPVRSGSLRLMRSMSLSPETQGCSHAPIGSKIASLTILVMIPLMGSEPRSPIYGTSKGWKRYDCPLVYWFWYGTITKMRWIGVRQTDVSWVIEGRR